MNEDKPVKKLSELPIKHTAIALLTQEGVEAQDIANSLNYKKHSVQTIQSKLKKWTFTGDLSSQKIAHKTIKSLAQGKTPRGSNIKEIKDNTSFQAAKYISDHNDPVVQHVKTQNEHVVAIMTPESLDKYK